MLIKNACVGAWRSLVAHLNGVQGVGGSNPLAPTINEYNKKKGLAKWLTFFLAEPPATIGSMASILFNLSGFQIIGDPAGVVSLIESRHHIRIKLGANTFINDFNDQAVFHFLAVGAVGSHGIVNIGHR